ncbi:MAG: DUF3788 family protein [Bacteroidetes bacterium]|nr:DUF3788 family protein [Bacteroidota bacterium]
MEKLEAFTNQNYPQATAAWNYSGDKYGWSYQIKDNKRVIIYLLPRDHFFRVALVFGAKAMDQIIESDIAEFIKNELLAAKQYAEGRGIRIEVKDSSTIEDILKLIKIKISN